MSASRNHKSYRILLADDHILHRSMALRMLHKNQCHGVAAQNGAEAIEIFQREPFDAVLLDIQMPQVDGFETARAIRKLEAHSQTRAYLIAQTAFCSSQDRQRCIDSGMDAYLSKPWRIEDLFDILAQLERLPDTPEQPSTRHRLIEVTPRLPDSSNPPDPVTHPASVSEKNSPTQINPFAAALARLEGDMSILREQLQLFLATSPEVLSDLAQNIVHQNARQIAHQAHRLKGLLLAFDAERGVQFADKIEKQAISSQLEETPQTFAELYDFVSHFQMEVTRFLNTSSIQD